MIDHENELFNIIATALRATYDGIYVANEYVSQPPRFPAVMIDEMDNSVDERAIDTGAIENAANVMYQVDVYSNLIQGKKAQAKAIIASIDEQMSRMRFVRTFKNPVQNMNDSTIYRITARYRRKITDEEEL